MPSTFAVYHRRLTYDEAAALRGVLQTVLERFLVTLEAGPPPCHLCPLYQRWAHLGDYRCSKNDVMPCVTAMQKFVAAAARCRSDLSERRLHGKPSRRGVCRRCGKPFVAKPVGIIPRDCPTCQVVSTREAGIRRNRAWREKRRAPSE